MKGDFTRFTFDPTKRYTNVLKQQGRVDLDADWNEQSAIDTYLDRVSRMDLSGVKSGAPSLSPGFEITVPAGGGDLNISAGRFYAEGIICELFAATTYLTQPFPPATPPPFTAVPAGGRTDSVYLDVWQRHITAIEDPSIKEIALGGPDTTTRLQTIFQIRINENVGPIDCPGATFPALSNAQMTASLVPVPPEDDLCLIGATGGYRGLENRLYRVEVDTGGALGIATFKWSRDNGSVVFPISEFVAGQPTKIRVKRLGRDQVLTLHAGDWVEVLDDHNDLAGIPGTIAQVQSIDAANLELTLSVAVSGSLTLHPKVRRWDQKSAPIATSATAIPLEDGIQVAFGGTNFKTGDYWMFAARATDGTIQTLTNAPAQGIKHVYAQLAIVTWTSPTAATVHDCRSIFPSKGDNCCCCTVTVGDGLTSKGDFTSIQAAIDSLAGSTDFAEVCILPGKYNLAAPVQVNRNKLWIHGCGKRSPIVAPPGAAAFVILATSIWMDSLMITSEQSGPAISAIARDLRISNCDLTVAETGYALLLQARSCQIADNRCEGGVLITEGSALVEIIENHIEGSQSAGIAFGPASLFPGGVAQDRGNPITAVQIYSNRISGNQDSGICTLARADDRFPGVNDLVIAGNLISNNVRSPEGNSIAWGGIVLENSSQIRISDNQINENGFSSPGACGIFLSECESVDIEENSILDNGNANDVVALRCVNFQTMMVNAPPDPFPVTGLDITTTAGTIQPVIGKQGSQTGLIARGLVIKHDAADAIEITLVLDKGETMRLRAFNAANTQVGPPLNVVGTSAPQTVQLAGQGIVLVAVDSRAEVPLILTYCRLTTPVARRPQGGIIANLITTERAPDPAAFFPAGYPAMRVHNNVVNTPAGHSLLINAIGQVSVEGNSLTSNGVIIQPGLEFVLPFSVAIYDFGVTYAPQNTPFLLSSYLAIISAGPTGFPNSDFIFDGRILFQGNQVAYRALNGTFANGAWAFGIVGLDACQVANNQFRVEAAGRLLGFDLVVSGDAVCTTGNAFAELPNSAFFSAYTVGRHVITSLNQAMHCLFVHGSEQTVNASNQVSISTLCPTLNEIFGGNN